MDVLAFDGRMGASGDMLLGALLAAGATPDVLAPVEDALDLRYAIGETTKNGIRATDVAVVVSGEQPAAGDETHDHDTDDHPHDHGHDRHHDHDHEGHDGEVEGRAVFTL